MKSNIPEGRVVRDPDEEGGITLDIMLYGNAYVRTPIPEWWGSLNHAFDVLTGPITDDDHRSIEGKTPGECDESAGGTA